MMTNQEYAEILDYVAERHNEVDSLVMYKVHSAHNPKTNSIDKVEIKLNYTKDGTPLPEINGRLTKAQKKNVVQRNMQFRGENCTKEQVIEFINQMIEDRLYQGMA